MFSNIGGKIKVLAKVTCWIGIVASIIIGLVCMFGTVNYNGTAVSGVLAGILFIVLGALASWVSSFVLFGFGELIDKTTENNEYLKQIANK